MPRVALRALLLMALGALMPTGSAQAAPITLEVMGTISHATWDVFVPGAEVKWLLTYDPDLAPPLSPLLGFLFYDLPGTSFDWRVEFGSFTYHWSRRGPSALQIGSALDTLSLDNSLSGVATEGPAFMDPQPAYPTAFDASLTWAEPITSARTLLPRFVPEGTITGQFNLSFGPTPDSGCACGQGVVGEFTSVRQVPVQVPEPATWLLMGLGLISVLRLRRR